MSLYHMREYLWQKVVIRWTGHPRDQSCTEDLSHSPPDVTLKDVMMRLEPIVVKLQGLMIWDQPYHSMVALIAFNCLYWLFVWFNRFSFYSYLAIALFCIYFLKLWTQYIWPEIRVPPNPSTDTEGWTPVHPNVLSAPEINHYINELCVMSRAVILWFIRLRREKRFKFFITTTSILFMTAIIGRLVPGVLIVYSITMIMALGPGFALYVLPDGLYEVLRNFFIPNAKNDETDGSDSQESKGSDDISEKERLSEIALHEYLKSTEYELNAMYDKSEDSSLQLLSDTQLDITLDKELGIEAQLNDEDIKLDTRSLSSHSSRSSGGIRFFTSHFSRNSSSDNIEDDYELISDTEIQDFAKGSQNRRHKN